MLKNQRQLEIVEILKAEGFATVTSLSERLFASLPTIRRDLTA
ncbi:MAG: DeoR family transcriptional regulator, partial [Clostridia bacterium]|nr:DeoR family transcriptional regulator [Clostridia bacterium]